MYVPADREKSRLTWCWAARWLIAWENLDCCFFFEKQEIGWQRVLTHSYEAGWRYDTKTTSTSDHAHLKFHWSLFSSKAVIKVLLAFEPCLLVSYLEFAEPSGYGFWNQLILIFKVCSRTCPRVLSGNWIYLCYEFATNLLPSPRLAGTCNVERPRLKGLSVHCRRP